MEEVVISRIAIAGYLLGTHLVVRYCASNLFRRVPALVMSYSCDLRADFHGGNTGSNPVGDAKPLNDLQGPKV
jgi:hypothetical protein